MTAGRRIDWVHGTPWDAIKHYARWRDAIEQADDGNCGLLIDLLRTESTELGHEARLLFADLLERRRLRRKPGRQATPAYRLSPQEARIADLKARYRSFRKSGQTSENAARSALRERKRSELLLGDMQGATYSEAQIDELIDEREVEELIAAVWGQRGSTRRITKRQTGKSPRP